MTDRPDRAQVGKIGEDTACKYLKKHGFTIIERNYWQKWGEIDVVASKACLPAGRDKLSFKPIDVLHFIEVKAVVGIRSGEDYLAEENVHPWKLKRLSRAIQTYLLQRNVADDKEWQVDVLTVELDFETRRARVKLLPDIGL